MNILFRSLNENRSDYITDGLIIGLRQNGFNVIDYPKRKSLYKSFIFSNWYADRNLWHFGNEEDNINRNNITWIDLVINDSSLFEDLEINRPSISLMTNDPIDKAPYPHHFSKNRMGIKEKHMYEDEIKNRTQNDFALHHTVDKEDCKLNHGDKTNIFISFLNTEGMRQDLINEFGNKIYSTKGEYYNAIRDSKYGISCYSKQGTDCQRDAEIAGNTLLCLAKHPQIVYDEASYRDGINCIEFSSIEELKEKINYYNNNPDKYNQLLINCYLHTLKYRTHNAQALRFIEWILK